MQLQRLIDAMEQIAPTRYAEPWDNVGLIAGDPSQIVRDVMLTIDYTPEVAREAAGLDCQAVIAYHPPIFDALKRVTSHGAASLIYDALRRGVALYSPHTALDVAPGGTNDVLADARALIQVASAEEQKGPRLTEQIEQLGQLVELASMPLPVRLESDQLTNVIV